MSSKAAPTMEFLRALGSHLTPTDRKGKGDRYEDLPMCYVAGPMRGLPFYNFPAFHTTAAILRKAGWYVFSPAENDEGKGLTPPEDGDPSLALPLKEYMVEDLSQVCQSDCIFVLSGWENSKGALLEVQVAQYLEIPVVDIQDGCRLVPMGNDSEGAWVSRDFEWLETFTKYGAISVDPVQADALDKMMYNAEEPRLDFSEWDHHEEKPSKRQGEDFSRRVDDLPPGVTIITDPEEIQKALEQLGLVRTNPESEAIPVSGNETLPTSSEARKGIPLTSGVLDYFPAALAEVAKVSKAGNDKHNPGESLHWARGKSTDQADCIARHLLERGGFDEDTGLRHSAQLAWRALALLQIELEEAGAPLARGATED